MTSSVLVIEDVKRRLDSIVKKRFGLDVSAIKEEIGDIKLLGPKFGMPPRDLLYLFFDVEKEFEITIPQESIASGDFSTYNGIVKTIYDALKNE